MVIKKTLPRAPVVLSAEERRRVVQFVGILVEVDQRVSARHVESRHVSANKRKASEEKKTRLKQKQKNKVRNICEPCSFSNSFKFVPEANKDFNSLFLFI